MPQPPNKTLTGPQYSPWAGFLSYLVPGLGQIVQGRIGKGLLFLICLYSLFFYGMYLGSWSNVYLPDMADEPNTFKLPRPVFNLYNRLQFAGQFWIGVAAWPALWQYNTYDSARVEDAEPAPQDAAARKTSWWSALATFERAPYENREDRERRGLGSRRRNEAPADWPGKTLNELQTEGDKTWDLAWVCTVIAGVLNVLVIYDACAGPAFGDNEAKRESDAQPQEAVA